MFSILANPIDTTPPNLQKLDLASVIITKNYGSLAGRNTAAQDMDGGDAYKVIETVGATNINNHFVMQPDPGILETADLGSQGFFISTYNNRTAKARIAFQAPMKAGQTIQGFAITMATESLAGSGVTATLAVSLETIDTDGTVAVIATHTAEISANKPQTAFWAAKAASPVTITTGQRVAISITMTPLAGAHNTTNYLSVSLLHAAGKSITKIY